MTSAVDNITLHTHYKNTTLFFLLSDINPVWKQQKIKKLARSISKFLHGLSPRSFNELPYNGKVARAVLEATRTAFQLTGDCATFKLMLAVLIRHVGTSDSCLNYVRRLQVLNRNNRWKVAIDKLYVIF